MQPALTIAIRAGIGIAGSFGITFLFSRVLPVNAITVGFFYLILVLALASTWGFIEAAIASVASMLLYNFFFLPPVGQFTIADPENWVALFTFLLTALVASHLSDRAKREALEARRRQRETEQMYALSRAILLTDTAQAIGPPAAQHIAQIFNSPAVVLFDAQSGSPFHGGAGDIPGIDAMLRQVVLQGSPEHLPSSDVQCWPIALGGRPIGALAMQGVHVSDSAIQALLNLVAIALERVRTGEAANRAEVSRQSEEFKSTLLDAIAHEFKTPLTSIKAASTTLLGDANAVGVAQREMLQIIDEETDRMSLLVTEAVKMAQIDAGKVKFERNALAMGPILRAAISSFGGRGEDRFIGQDSADGLPLVYADAEMVSLALRQVLDNGLKYSSPATPIEFRAELEPERVILRIMDLGPGIPERDRERVFEKFFRSSNNRDKVPGSGLGLHIAREIVRTLGGDLWVEGRADQTKTGSEFCLALPRFSGQEIQSAHE